MKRSYLEKAKGRPSLYYIVAEVFLFSFFSCFSLYSLGAAQEIFLYSSDFLKVDKGWSLEFQEGASLHFNQTSQGLEASWKGFSWLPSTEILPIFSGNNLYQETGLILSLIRKGCPKGKYEMKNSEGDKIVVRAQRSQTHLFSPFQGKKEEVIFCHLENKEKNMDFRMTLDSKNHPLTLQWKSQPVLHLRRLVSPALLQFENEQKRNSTLDFQQEEIVARYEVENDHTNVELRYKMGGKQKETITLTLVIPVYLYDNSTKNKRVLKNRVALLKTEGEKKKTLLQLLRVVHYPRGSSARNWTFLADLGYGIVGESLENEITIWNRTELGEEERTRISSSRLVFDLTSLLYLGSWLNQEGLSKQKLRYFNDHRVLPANLVRKGNQKIRIQEREVVITPYVLVQEGEEKEIFRLSIGKQDQILYQWEYLLTQKKLTLTDIENEAIKKRIEWKEQFQKDHQIVLVSYEKK